MECFYQILIILYIPNHTIPNSIQFKCVDCVLCVQSRSIHHYYTTHKLDLGTWITFGTNSVATITTITEYPNKPKEEITKREKTNILAKWTASTAIKITMDRVAAFFFIIINNIRCLRSTMSYLHLYLCMWTIVDTDLIENMLKSWGEKIQTKLEF